MNRIRIFLILIALSIDLFSLDIVGMKCRWLIQPKNAFDICYNDKEKHPNYTSYDLVWDKVKKYHSRKYIRFKPDMRIPSNYRSYPGDYTRSGYDRGHLAPNAQFDWDIEVQRSTFLMSNIAPQNPNLNRYIWAALEKHVRNLTKKFKHVEVITGVCGNQGYIRNHVEIPRYWFKIIKTKYSTEYFLAKNRAYPSKNFKLLKSSKSEIERLCRINIKD